MHLRKQTKPNGRVYLSIVQSYRTAEGKSRSKTLWSLGYLDDLEKTHADPIAHFQQVVEDLNNMHEEDRAPILPVSFSPLAKIPFGTGSKIEAGAAVVLNVLHRNLGLKDAIANCGAENASAVRAEQIVELLAWNRIAHPQLILDAWEQRDCVPGLESLTRNDVFKGFDTLGTHARDIVTRVNERLDVHHHDTKTAYAFCFVVNFYVEEFSWTHPSGKKRWEDRPSPLIQLAIMVDRQGIPIDYNVFTSALATHLSSFPAVQDLAIRHPEARLIIVSNKTVGSSAEELAFLLDYDCGFVMLQSMRKGQRISREWVLDGSGYQPIGVNGSRYKERMSIRSVDRIYNHKRPNSIAVKEVAFWWREAFERNRFDRFRIIRRNEDTFSHGAPSDGSERPVRAVRGTGDAKPGEVGDHIWEVYWDKIAADEAMDGYCNIITSELDLDGSAVIDLYQNLFMLRSFFKPPWGEWSTCPGNVSRDNYIQTHFLVCYIAACVSQLLYADVGERFPDESIGATLSRLTGREITPGQFFFDFRTRLSDALAEHASVDFARPLVSASELRAMMKEARREH